MAAARVAAEARAGAARMAAWRAHSYAADEAGAAAALRLDAARRPVRRAPDELLVRVHASSINPIDLAMIRGYGSRVLNAWRALEGSEGLEFPLTPGRDFVGTVAGAAPGAPLAPGARVWGVLPPHRVGAHADYVLAKTSWVSLAPENLDDLQAGGALYGALTACAALRVGGLAPGGEGGKRVLVLGLGGVGHAAVQLLVRDRHHVVVSCAGEQAEAARALGAEPLDRRQEDYADRLQQAGPFDVVLDCAGQGGAGAARLACAFGAYVTLTSPLLRRTDAAGLLPGSVAAAADLIQQNLAVRQPTQKASLAACLPRVRWAFFSPRADDIELLRRRAEREQFSVAVEQVWSWREASAAYARASRGHARGKLLLDFAAP
ncbi:reticulon-4-interacting protein 1, mitochondrial [Cydia pomonella]|uniref:reticulon-4-interacting protein 1, mitochondrial n=1 Tax=Cydia pomonella TaxID=82600 RepID=UPI002ADD3377|nr:reticulon-4-interacting protein 1, mitochondrial [Cydia pomonella]XP_061715508.1 reticulon-4-interacting protein 1, mitochondrial [Cydia pomonella]XP_061715510.1 reticulon-4-interacting protein 1, mitochondrial [Cydia pomonella]XP_061715511.1 reticulon-4-interacting protein 1, mitochondrial [Cydia pomonella]